MATEDMDNFYESLRNENLKAYGDHMEHLEHYSNMYADDSHFIYEILQNAEDALASKVKFVLYKDRLEIFHDGRRLFDENDVKAITKISNSTKKDDVNKVGKFGLGFKSVYAVTDAPQIHSGTYDFKIEKLIRPYPIEHKDVTSPYTTLFILPFKQEKSAQVYLKLTQKFQQLELKTVLFLENIKEIGWEIKDGGCDKNSGYYLKETVNKNQFGFKEVTCLDEDDFEKWFVFSKGSRDEAFVEIAFKYDKDIDQIVPAKDTDLVVLFPTEKATGLNFIINGNFQTTQSRENIPSDSEHNQLLIGKIQELLQSVVPELKNKGFMNISLMKTLPTDKSRFTLDKKMAFFEPIYDTVKELFKKQELVPTTEPGVYAKADDLAYARVSELTSLFTPYHKKWMTTEITHQNKNKDLHDYFTDELKVPTFTPEQFCRDYLSKEFLSNKSDEWFKQLYAFLSEQPALWRANTNPKGRASNEGPVRSKPIIKLANDNLVTPNEGAFLPTGTSDSEYQTVKKCFVEDKDSYDFLCRLGLKQPNMVDALEKNVLKKYNEDQTEIAVDEYLQDMKKILTVLRSSDVTDNEKQRIKEYPIIRCDDGQFRKPAVVYQNVEDLCTWFNGQKRNYNDRCLDKNALDTLGVSDVPKWKTNVLESDQIPSNIREETRTMSRKDYLVDLWLDGLDELTVTEDTAVQIANVIYRTYKVFGTKHPEWCSKEITLFNSVYIWIRNGQLERSIPTHILNKLHSMEWVLTRDGRLANPMQVGVDQIHPDVLFLTELPECVFGSDLKHSLLSQLEQMGACPVLCNSPEEAEEVQRFLEESRAKKLQKTEEISSVENEPDDESWNPEVDVDDVDIEEGMLRYIGADRGDVGYVNNTKDTQATCQNEDSSQTQKQEKFSERDKQKIGEYGEKAVKRYLMEIENIPESEITILNTNKENSTGRDIEITKDGELVRYIEVKSTTEIPPCRHMFETSGKQWEVARKHQDKYWLYCVFGVGTDQITVLPIQNPNKQWKDGKIEAHPVNFVVKA